MNSNVYKLVYCSRNEIRGSETEVAAQIETILASSRRNNAGLQITGALLYNAGDFAQALEGPLKSVEQVFELIQRDPRHSEVTVVQSGPDDRRDFADWAMAFSGSNPPEKTSAAANAFRAAFAKSEGAGERMLSILKALVVRDGSDGVVLA